ncbi:MAG: segregation/condensation protein A [Anaerolineales bacterium]|nr:segregation/condensation protein A [Anaerolineales bacterium]MCX7756501.1 segregation/condensation protein A [Anaerolineales bacterium]MDW8278642.1 segregation/condensation protein A [Anaerolineales bacterium]
MDLNIASHQTGKYLVQTPVYEGPLDLLLQLIERAELDITALSLAMVTDQYLQHIRQMQEARAEEISAFLVIAARLIQIKSEALLPRPPVREAGEEDPAENLARQLRLYKKFKEAAAWLEQREVQGLRTYLRLAPPPKIEGRLDLSGLTLADLLEAAESSLRREKEKQSLGTVIAPPKVTIRQKITHIAARLNQQRQARFQELVEDSRSRLEVVVTFLALLELVKRYRVAARQEALFGEIYIERTEDWEEGEEFELEFE